MWTWQSIPLGKTKDGFGEEYLLVAKNQHGKMVTRQLAYRPDFVNVYDMISHIQSSIRSVEKEIERLCL